MNWTIVRDRKERFVIDDERRRRIGGALVRNRERLERQPANKNRERQKREGPSRQYYQQIKALWPTPLAPILGGADKCRSPLQHQPPSTFNLLALSMFCGDLACLCSSDDLISAACRLLQHGKTTDWQCFQPFFSQKPCDFA